MARIKEVVLEVFYAIAPIVGIITILQFTLIRMPAQYFLQFLIGAVMLSMGLVLFLLGAHMGFLPFGELIGTNLPRLGKVWLFVLFGFLLGFVVTVAEPDVRVLATQVDVVSGNQVSKNLLIYSVSLGVAFFVGLAMLRVILNIPLKYLLYAGYAIVFLLAAFTPAYFVPVGFDAGGVTTGPMTVPFIVALGVGISSVLGGRDPSTDGFGFVALASIGPILAVLLLGVI
ncbi:MAG: DUF1538 domain-containing protein [Clostridia bacterium]|jgi:hypothetical protein|nr:DUF1538 domain-containing protein [Clostridia bacterium]